MRLWLLAIFCFASQGVFAQGPLPFEPKDEIVARKNAWTVGLLSGQIEGLYPRFAAEMQKVLDDKDEMRVMPILAYGAASNVEDLLYTRGVDVAFTQSDVLHYFKTTRNIPGLSDRIHYITALYSTELHILARPEIKTIQNLDGKNVSFGPVGNSASLTGPIVFDRLKIKTNQKNFDHTTGLEKLKTGEVDAVVRMIGKPSVDSFNKVPKDAGFHFLSISYDDASKKVFDDLYSLGELTHNDYPDLIPEGEVVDTVSVTTVLAVYNWAKNTDRFRRVERFTRYFFERFDGFLAPGFHPKWKEVNLAAPVPGWRRSSVAEQMLQQRRTTPRAELPARQETRTRQDGDLSRELAVFLESRGAGSPRTTAEAEAIMKDFLAWRERQGQRQ
jgi:TRAP-type uncharacterized transport system substrate-binding protein